MGENDHYQCAPDVSAWLTQTVTLWVTGERCETLRQAGLAKQPFWSWRVSSVGRMHLSSGGSGCPYTKVKDSKVWIPVGWDAFPFKVISFNNVSKDSISIFINIPTVGTNTKVLFISHCRWARMVMWSSDGILQLLWLPSIATMLILQILNLTSTHFQLT